MAAAVLAAVTAVAVAAVAERAAAAAAAATMTMAICALCPDRLHDGEIQLERGPVGHRNDGAPTGT